MTSTFSIPAAFLACLFFSSAAGNAHSEPVSILKGSSEAQPILMPASPYSDMKAKAYAWTILGTAVPIGSAYLLANSASGDLSDLAGWLAVGGIFVGPSLGQFYAHAPGQGFLGIGIRVVGAFLTILGFAESLSGLGCEMEKCPEPKDGTPLMIIGSITYLGGVFYSLFDTGNAVDRYRYHASDSQFGWMPTVSPGNGGTTRTGLSAWMRF